MQELALIEIKNPLEIFSTPKGLDAIIDKIEAEVKSVDRDISTKEGRENIRSIAFKLAKSKTAMDKMGKDLTEAQRAQITAVNIERSRAWDRMEALQEEIRKPLTDWENAEKSRVEGHETALANIEKLSEFPETPATAQIEERLKQFNALEPRNWQEFESRYTAAAKHTADSLDSRLQESRKRDAEQAELDRLRREEADRKQKEHEDRIAAEASEKAKKVAEEKSRLEAESERKRNEEERFKIEGEKQAALDAYEKSEREKLAAIAKAESDRVAAEEKARRDSEVAVQRERERQEAIKKAEEQETARREADKNHRKKINNEALEAMVVVLNTAISPTDQAKAVIAAIAKGEIPHVTIRY